MSFGRMKQTRMQYQSQAHSDIFDGSQGIRATARGIQSLHEPVYFCLLHIHLGMRGGQIRHLCHGTHNHVAMAGETCRLPRQGTSSTPLLRRTPLRPLH